MVAGSEWLLMEKLLAFGEGMVLMSRLLRSGKRWCKRGNAVTRGNAWLHELPESISVFRKQFENNVT